LQHLAVEKQERIERLVLRAGRNTALRRQIAQKLFDLRGAHSARVPHPVKQDETPCPLHVAILGAAGIMPHTQQQAQLIEHARRPRPGEFAQSGAHHAFVEQRQRRAGLGQRLQRFALRLRHVLQKVCHLG
jgi:hypothetical protein